jgi:hypothetical protein
MFKPFVGSLAEADSVPICYRVRLFPDQNAVLGLSKLLRQFELVIGADSATEWLIVVVLPRKNFGCVLWQADMISRCGLIVPLLR